MCQMLPCLGLMPTVSSVVERGEAGHNDLNLRLILSCKTLKKYKLKGGGGSSHKLIIFNTCHVYQILAANFSSDVLFFGVS